jgi:hypothetical protein
MFWFCTTIPALRPFTIVRQKQSPSQPLNKPKSANLRGYARVLAPTCARDAVGLFAPGSVERGILPGDGAVVQEGARAARCLLMRGEGIRETPTGTA